MSIRKIQKNTICLKRAKCKKYTYPFFLATLAIALAGCMVGPDYKRPDVSAATAYKDHAYKELGGWKQALPANGLKRGEWWEVFGDPLLNDLEKQVDAANESLKQAQAQYLQAAAAVSQARASLWPTLSTNLAIQRTGRYSTAGGGTVTGGTVAAGKGYTNSFQMPLTASWTPDLWGSVRRTIEGDVATAQSDAAMLENTRLSLQATLAQTYFELRIADEQKRLNEDTVVAYQKSLDLTVNQYNVGVAARADVVTAQTQLKNAQVQLINVGVARAQYEHAIAVLIGKTPAQFSLAAQPLQTEPPALPVDLPSMLLLRRPDVAVAERQAAAANAQIGVAEAAWFPTLSLSGTYGVSNSLWSQLFTAPSRYWTVGPRIAETLFDAGARSAQTAQARASYDAAAANYRQVALAAFQNVEDNLAALRILAEQAQAQDEAVKLAEQALAITINQYRAGMVSYINVITAQATAYNAHGAAITLRGTRLSDSVALIAALGGGWNMKDLPADHEISRHSQASGDKKIE